MKKMPFLALLLLIFFSSACSGLLPPAATLTPTPVPPTKTPLPPTPTPTSTPTPTPTPVPGGPCDNPLTPLVQGNEWLYRSTGANGVSRQKVTIGAVGEDRAEITMVDLDTGQTVRDVIFCTQGDIENFPVLFISMLLADYVDHVINTYHTTGVYAPSYSILAQKGWTYSWETEYLSEETVLVKVPGTTLIAYISANAIFKYDWQVENIRAAVTVPAGPYPQALKVTQTWQTPITLMGLPDVQATGVGGVLSVETIQWYEPYIGLLKAQVTAVTVWVPGLLEVPLTLDRVIELSSFTPGQ